jgi:hypothetical protein
LTYLTLIHEATQGRIEELIEQLGDGDIKWNEIETAICPDTCGTDNLKKSQVLSVYTSGRNANVDFPHKVARGVSDLMMCPGASLWMLEDL